MPFILNITMIIVFVFHKFIFMIIQMKNMIKIELLKFIGEQLRVRYNEPRVHVAVNCASIGCPALFPEAFTAAKLDAQLEDGMQRFLGDKTRNRYADGKLEVSMIFKWFREDFEKGHKGFTKLEDVFAKYADQMATAPADREKIKAKSVSISNLDYDWSLNDAGR